MLNHFSATLRTAACQTPLSMGFYRQEYWNGFPFPLDLPDPEIEPASLMSPALAGGFFTTSSTWEAQLSSIRKGKIPRLGSPLSLFIDFLHTGLLQPPRELLPYTDAGHQQEGAMGGEIFSI